MKKKTGYEASAADKKHDAGKPKGWEGSKADNKGDAKIKKAMKKKGGKK